MKNPFNRIVTSSPVNRQAALSMSKGVAPPPERVPDWHVHLKAPPLMMRVPVRWRGGDIMEDLTGQQFGDLVVKGLLQDLRHRRWVVRCVCGDYEVRRSSALKLGLAQRCYVCENNRRRREGLGPYSA